MSGSDGTAQAPVGSSVLAAMRLPIIASVIRCQVLLFRLAPVFEYMCSLPQVMAHSRGAPPFAPCQEAPG